MIGICDGEVGKTNKQRVFLNFVLLLLLLFSFGGRIQCREQAWGGLENEWNWGE